MFESAESEHPRLTNCEISNNSNPIPTNNNNNNNNIPTYVITIHQRYRWTDRQRTYDRKTALYTKV